VVVGACGQAFGMGFEGSVQCHGSRVVDLTVGAVMDGNYFDAEAAAKRINSRQFFIAVAKRGHSPSPTNWRRKANFACGGSRKEQVGNLWGRDLRTSLRSVSPECRRYGNILMDSQGQRKSVARCLGCMHRDSVGHVPGGGRQLVLHFELASNPHPALTTKPTHSHRILKTYNGIDQTTARASKKEWCPKGVS